MTKMCKVIQMFQDVQIQLYLPYKQNEQGKLVKFIIFRKQLSLQLKIPNYYKNKNKQTNQMGSQVCKNAQDDNDLSMDPLSSEFQVSSPVIITYQFNDLIDRIKKIRQITDPRENHKLKWYESKRYGFKLFGQIKNRRPFGQCLFYFDSDKFATDKNGEYFLKNKNPAIITTKISTHYMFSENTLIIYDDKSYYIGEIQAKKYQIPKATGKGLLVKPDFIYQGEFQDGYPEGYGRYRTKYLEFTGMLKKGRPFGQCIEKTAKGIFIGRITQNSKIGFLITPQNKRFQVNQKLAQSEIKL